MALFYILIQDYRTRSFLGWCTLEELKELRPKYPYLQMSPILTSLIEENLKHCLHCSPKQIEQHPEIGELLKVYNEGERLRQVTTELNNFALSDMMKQLKPGVKEKSEEHKERK